MPAGMFPGQTRWLVLIVLSTCLSAGCVTYSLRQSDIYQALNNGDYAFALQVLETQKAGRRDRVLYQLNKAMLLRLSGDYLASNALLEEAKGTMQRLAATSITENITSVAVNEATRSYAGQPYEHLFLYVYKALNYLALSQPDSARVEMLQADVKIKEWLADKSLEGVKASAFMRYLSGLVFEMLGEWSDALIAYRKAHEIYRHNERSTPGFLQHDLLRLTAFQGLQDEHRMFQQLFGLEDWPAMQALQDNAELIVVHGQGFVSALQQQLIYSFSTELKHNVQIALPHYAEFYPSVVPVSVGIDQKWLQAGPVENLEQLVRDNLAARLPGITLRAVARVVVKKKLAAEARDEHFFAGVVADIAGLVTEVADTRSWLSLPANIQLLRVVLPPGEYRVRLPGHDRTERIIHLQAGEKKIISTHSSSTYH